MPSTLNLVATIVRHASLLRRDPLGFLDVLAGPARARCLAGLPYGPHGGQALDLYLPPAPSSVPAPCVLFFHGGRWTTGARAQYRFVAEALAARGIATAVCDYRKYPAFRFPVFVEDAAAAVAWALEHAPRHGLDAGLLFLMGHSAGAHLAALATMDRRYTLGHGVDPDSVAGLVLMSGPFDFFPIREADLQDLFGPEEFHSESQPLRFVRRGLPPMLMLHGRDDRTVHPSNSARMASALRDVGVCARTILYDGVSHTSIVGGLCEELQSWIAPVLDDAVSFVEGRVRQLRAGQPAGVSRDA